MSNKTPGFLTLLEKSIKQNAKICEDIKELVNFSAKEKDAIIADIAARPGVKDAESIYNSIVASYNAAAHHLHIQNNSTLELIKKLKPN